MAEINDFDSFDVASSSDDFIHEEVEHEITNCNKNGEDFHAKTISNTNYVFPTFMTLDFSSSKDSNVEEKDTDIQKEEVFEFISQEGPNFGEEEVDKAPDFIEEHFNKNPIVAQDSVALQKKQCFFVQITQKQSCL